MTDDEVTLPLIGENSSHRCFRASIATVKVLVFTVSTSNDAASKFIGTSRQMLLDQPKTGVLIAVKGPKSRHSGENGVLTISEREMSLIESEMGGHEAQSLAMLLRELYRLSETYLIDLFSEIAREDKRVLFTHHKISHKDVMEVVDVGELRDRIIENRKEELTRIGYDGLVKEFSKVGLEIVPPDTEVNRKECDSLRYRLKWLAATRNLLEHNKGEVNRIFLDEFPNGNLSIGDRLQIHLTDVAEAIAAVEFTADYLNVRAVDKST